MADNNGAHTADQPVKPEKAGASWQAQVAFYVSLATATFSAFQWWQGRREDRIKAAIEISRDYLKDERIDRLRQIVQDTLGSKVILGKQYSPEQEAELIIYFRRLDYLSFLLNHQRVDPNYVAETMKCDMILAALSLADTTPEFTRETRSFAKGAHASYCPQPPNFKLRHYLAASFDLMVVSLAIAFTRRCLRYATL